MAVARHRMGNRTTATHTASNLNRQGGRVMETKIKLKIKREVGRVGWGEVGLTANTAYCMEEAMILTNAHILTDIKTRNSTSDTDRKISLCPFSF